LQAQSDTPSTPGGENRVHGQWPAGTLLKKMPLGHFFFGSPRLLETLFPVLPHANYDLPEFHFPTFAFSTGKYLARNAGIVSRRLTAPHVIPKNPKKALLELLLITVTVFVFGNRKKKLPIQSEVSLLSDGPII